MRLNLFILLLLVSACIVQAQPTRLKSARFALKLMHEDVSKDSILNEIRFEDGRNDTLDIVRFDNVELGLYPLIISTHMPIKTDSLGQLSFKLADEQFENLLWLIDRVECKSFTRNFDGILLRATYRYHGDIKQYYVTDRKIVTAYLLLIEKELKTTADPDVLRTFYKFVSSTGLIKSVRGRIVWVEGP
jgi:hypothetical protein